MSSNKPNRLATTPPRASILSYLRSARNPSSTPPPSYRTVQTQTKKPTRSSSERTPLLDEESTTGFWGEPSYPPEDEDSWGLYEVLSAFAYISVIFILVVNVDVFLSRWSLGTRVGVGVQEWVASSAKVRLETVATEKMAWSEVQFCLEGHDRVAPAPRIWKFIPSEMIGECRSAVLELKAEDTEVWKLVFDDGILVGENTSGEGYAEGIMSVSDDDWDES